MHDDKIGLIRKLSPEKRALVLKALREGALKTQDPPIVPQDSSHGPIPLSLSQKRLWLLEQLHPGSRVYNELSALQVSGLLDVATIERCFTEIVRRHQILRTTFPAVEGGPIQVIAPAQPMKLLVVDIISLPKLEQEAEIERLTDKEARHSFNLVRGPLLRVTLIQLGARQNILLIAAHHIILDGWSIGIFRRELEELYKAFSEGKPSPLPELPIQYADFAIWQRKRLKKEDLETQLQYWTQQLKVLPQLLQLPVANPRPEIQTFRGAKQYFKLGMKLTQGLKALALHVNVTLFMTLLGGFLILLHRYSNQTDIPVGTVIANRNQAEIENLIGFFVNTLVMRGDLSGNPTTRDLLQRVGDMAIAAYEHQDLPFDRLVEALEPKRSSSHHPLFQVLFDLQNTPKSAVERSKLVFTPMEVSCIAARFDLILSMEDTSEGLQGYWQYNIDLFEPDTISRMSGHLQTLLEDMVVNPDHPISALSLLTREERAKMLGEWNQTHTASPKGKCIHQLFEVQAATTPDAIAAVYADQSITYQELNRRANQVAWHLLALGVRAESLVGIYMQRSVETVVALLGVLKAGGAYVPLDPSYPNERLAHILADANPVALLTQRHLVAALPAGSKHVICLDAEWEQRPSDRADEPVALVTPDNLAYVIYTSGTTGIPKGVLVNHGNLVHSTVARWDCYRQPVNKFLLLSPFAFDSFAAGFYWTLTVGGALILPEERLLHNIPELCRLISSQHISHLLTIPSLYAVILEEAQALDLASLQAVIVAGEPCTVRVVDEHHRRLGHVAMFNEYGPTEGTVWSTVYRCDALSARSSVPIGRPIANTQVYLLDAHLQPVPVSVPAELYIGGGGVARGYLNQPELTGEKFISVPLADIPSTRLYKTGDLARYLPDGNIEFLGRTDQQVKIHGFRVELGEIEAVLSQYSIVREAVVTVREDKEGNKFLVGNLSINPGSPFSIHELKRFLAEKLPTYALPSEFQILENFPRLYNGKVDRASLPTSRALHPATVVSFADDWTDLERSIADIWKATLNIETVGRQDNFFEIGGDSFSIIRVYNRLRNTTEKNLAITDLFKHPTINSLAQFIELDSVIGEI